MFTRQAAAHAGRLSVRPPAKLPERWVEGCYDCTLVGEEARLDHCPACLAWRTCFISPDRTVRCYACGADDIDVDPKILRALGLK